MRSLLIFILSLFKQGRFFICSYAGMISEKYVTRICAILYVEYKESVDSLDIQIASHVLCSMIHGDEISDGLKEYHDKNEEDLIVIINASKGMIFESILDKEARVLCAIEDISRGRFFSSKSFLAHIKLLLAARLLFKEMNSIDRHIDGLNCGIFAQREIRLPSMSDVFAIISSLAAAIVFSSVMYGVFLMYFLGAISDIEYFSISDFTSSGCVHGILPFIKSFIVALPIVFFERKRLKLYAINSITKGKKDYGLSRFFLLLYFLLFVSLFAYEIYKNDVHGVTYSIYLMVTYAAIVALSLALSYLRIKSMSAYITLITISIILMYNIYASYHNAMRISLGKESYSKISFTENALNKYSKANIVMRGDNFTALYDSISQSVVLVQTNNILTIQHDVKENKWIVLKMLSFFNTQEVTCKNE